VKKYRFSNSSAMKCSLHNQTRLLLEKTRLLADHSNGRAYAPLPALACYTAIQCFVCLSSVTKCIVAKQCVLEQKLLLTAYRMSYMRNRLVPKWMTLTFV